MKTKLKPGCAWCLLLLCMMTPTWGQAIKQADKLGPRILILADGADELSILAEQLADEGYRVRRIGQQDFAELLDGYAAVIVYVHKPLLPPVETALIEYAHGGGRLVVLHHALASAKRANPKWLEFLGVSMAPHNAQQYPWKVSGGLTFTMVNLAPRHYITTHNVSYNKAVEYRSPDREELRGRFPAFELHNTEIFHNQRHTDGKRKTILFGYLNETLADASHTGTMPTMEDTAGWYKHTGKGLTFYLQPGHAESDFRNMNFMNIILNCLNWSGDSPKTDTQ